MLWRSRNIMLVSALGGIALAAWACDQPAMPNSLKPDKPLLWVGAPPPTPACFRLTGGGRIDKPEPLTLIAQPKNTPDSRDFATFGFNARPTGCNELTGSGQIEWVDHNPDAPAGGFSFHASVQFFEAVADHYGDTGDPKNGCGRFTGYDGTFHGRDGSTYTDVSYVVEHACDRGEPGVGHDHIQICIGTSDPDACNAGSAPYRRNGILTGGNIQKHSL